MPEGRMLKRVISESKSLGNLKSDSARLLYTWLIPWLDVEGRHSADPDIIKGHIFPKIKSMTVAKIKGLLDDLATEGLMIIYVYNGEKYLQYTKFAEHQKLDKQREADSKIPPPPPNSGVTHEDSGVTHEDSLLIKANIIKAKLSPCPESKTPDEQDLKLTDLLIELMKKNNPNSSTLRRLTPKIKAEWIDQCRLLREQDNKSPGEIEAIIRFSQGDSFWKTNILSMPKFRKQWDQLWLKAKKASGSDRYDGIKAWLDKQTPETKHE